MGGERSRAEALAADVLRLSRNSLLVNLRFLDAALHRLPPVTAEETASMATDGAHLFYAPVHVLKCFATAREIPVRDYLHVVLHCVFRHMFVHTLVDHEAWDLSCDIAVESCITEIGLPSAAAPREKEQAETVSELKKTVKRLTAETLYRHFLDARLPAEEFSRLRDLFRADEHALWYEHGEVKGTRDEEDGADHGTEPAWEEISRRMQVDMETFSREKGGLAAELLLNLREVNRERYDYAAFLRKFAVRGEVMKINDSEFDQIFYTYGLRLYQKLPLVEPLEYKDVHRIREFVIAIDTSRSTSGELVESFLRKTWNILESTESFFSKVNVHVLQCDEEIREDVKITSREDMREYLKSLTIRGLGGTDFRPVFRHVDALIRENEFTNLKGLIYFTDGEGTYPSQKPGYETAFVFVDDDLEDPKVPPWAIRLVLRKEDLLEGEL